MKCPNCGAEIGRFDLSVNCRQCGINLYYSRQQEILSRDAKVCELEFASFHILTAKLKAAFVGGIWQRLRIAFIVICIGVLLIPFGKITLDIPLYSGSISFGGLGIYNAFTSGGLMALLDYIKLDAAKRAAMGSIAVFLCLAVLVLITAALLVLELLSFISIRKNAKAQAIISIVGVVVSVIGVICSLLLPRFAAGYSSISVTAKPGPGAFICAAAFAGLFFVNYMILHKDIKPEFKEVDLKRVEMHKKVKAGEVNIDDLPMPVFESEEEKEARLKLEEEAEKAEEREREKAAAKHHTGGADNVG
ncbi:MAG: hypothetical protein K6F09_03455 [Clostridiales bacterium]|nr:hypothetical protein [Clostridiales bacterium]